MCGNRGAQSPPAAARGLQKLLGSAVAGIGIRRSWENFFPPVLDGSVRNDILEGRNRARNVIMTNKRRGAVVSIFQRLTISIRCNA